MCLTRNEADLFVELLNGVEAIAGERSVRAVLARMTDDVVAHLEPRVASLDLDQRMEVVRSIYAHADPFTEVLRHGDDYVLVERNCPYLNAAVRRPDICSTTVSALRRLTGCEVVRERRVQDGDGCCAFRVRTETQSPERAEVRFELES